MQQCPLLVRFISARLAIKDNMVSLVLSFRLRLVWWGILGIIRQYFILSWDRCFRNFCPPKDDWHCSEQKPQEKSLQISPEVNWSHNSPTCTISLSFSAELGCFLHGLKAKWAQHYIPFPFHLMPNYFFTNKKPPQKRLHYFGITCKYAQK